MERLKQLIEKLKAEIESNAHSNQMMETVFDMIRSLSEEKQSTLRVDLPSHTIPIEELSGPSVSVLLNETFDSGKADMAELLQHQPIASIRSALGINEKYILLQAFFKGESSAFDNMMAALDDANSYEQARVIVSEYMLSIPMNEEQKQVFEKFDYLLKRRFLSI